ncbi:hypothetical protein C0993_008000 [Termitomyces sp. T159_Od127]|nr:hypothetical protein C0993_008000 [Termitomyces sp. T159_Od127]
MRSLKNGRSVQDCQNKHALSLLLSSTARRRSSSKLSFLAAPSSLIHLPPATDMPAPVSSSSPARTAPTSSAQPLKKKKRIVRRRGRAPADILSDDEIEREVATDDSDSDDDDLSSLSSDSESDTEPVSDEVVPDGHIRALTPGTSQSPGDRGTRDKPAEQAESFFAPNTAWSEMVADDEKTTESGDIPVIEFADFDAQHVPARPWHKKAKKPAKTAPMPDVPAPAPQVSGDHAPNEAEESQLVASSSRSRSSDHPKRLPGQTARQAYQQRLESDPSYVPTVGGFWSHDDRLLDKDLRSLSGWWRDRRGGRGRGNGFRGRGRGVFPGASVAEERGDDGKEVELPPIERTWGHDGFEEMKKREEQRKANQTQTQHSSGSASVRGRGFAPGRGGRRGFGRGGYVNTSGRSSANSGRIWFTQKPDKMWTKQHEGYLYFATDPALRPTSGQGPGILVKMPGSTQAKVVRIPYRLRPSIKTVASHADKEAKMYTVNLPDSLKEANVTKATVSTTETPVKEVAPSAQDLAPPKQSVPLVETVATVPASPARPHTHHSPPDHLITTSLRSEPEASIRLQLEQLSVEPGSSDPARIAKTEEAVLRHPLAEQPVEESSTTSRGEAVSTLPTMFSPPLPQPSPSYSSPYGYAPALPPGIAMNQHGVPYELATGRPVYLQAAPPPMYNPRPVMHSHLSPTFVPAHMPTPHSHSHSLSAVSPDFLAHSASHTPPMNGFIDPSTGTPIFSFPRQTSRIEIRAPGASSEVKPRAKLPGHISSGLRTSAASFEPSRTLSDSSSSGYYPTLNSPENGSLPSYVPVEGAEGAVDGVQHDPAMMAYAQYPQQQQYYYPEAYGYAFNPYMDMQHIQPYEGTVYY